MDGRRIDYVHVIQQTVSVERMRFLEKKKRCKRHGSTQDRKESTERRARRDEELRGVAEHDSGAVFVDWVNVMYWSC
jgi:hypothetical protein